MQICKVACFTYMKIFMYTGVPAESGTIASIFPQDSDSIFPSVLVNQDRHAYEDEVLVLQNNGIIENNEDNPVKNKLQSELEEFRLIIEEQKLELYEKNKEIGLLQMERTRFEGIHNFMWSYAYMCKYMYVHTCMYNYIHT